MKYLNLGCGENYSSQPEWTNLNFNSTGPGVIAHNLLNGIPFDDNSFDLVYHSHVLEHFTKDDAEIFLKECFRVLKPGGIIRIAVPDLEGIVRNYIQFLDQLKINPQDEITRLNYEWTMLELYDQAVRNYGGGNMGRYLFQEQIKNEAFVLTRLGEEGRQVRNAVMGQQANVQTGADRSFLGGLLRNLKDNIKAWLLIQLNTNLKTVLIGNYRASGEVHQWMYDRYSLSALLFKLGADSVNQRDAYTSSINNWSDYKLDSLENGVRKPDSFFIEGVKC